MMYSCTFLHCNNHLIIIIAFACIHIFLRNKQHLQESWHLYVIGCYIRFYMILHVTNIFFYIKAQSYVLVRIGR